MIRVSLFVISFVMITCAMGTANATTVKWCLNFETDYQFDWDRGEDVLLPDADDENHVTVPASRLQYLIFHCHDDDCLEPESPYVWQGYLDSDGCTSAKTMYAGENQRFRIMATSVAANPPDIRRLFVLPDGVLFGNEDGVEQYSTAYTINVISGDHIYTHELYFSSEVKSLLGVGCSTIKKASDNDWDLLTDIWMSAWDSPPGPTPDNNCGTYTMKDPYSENSYYVCIDEDNLDMKFIIGHQFGDAFALMRDGLHNGGSDGSEGYLRATDVEGRCDCDLLYTSGRPFCIGSREFTGKAQREGYASFQSTVTMNARSSYGGVFVNDYRTMKWTTTHGGILPAIPTIPPSAPYWEAPVSVDLDDDENVKWMEYECNPSGEFTHFATEWDWMDFFWNLWTEGGTSNRYTVSQMNGIWAGVLMPPYDLGGFEAAELCCQVTDGVPTDCVPHNLDLPIACGTGALASYPYVREVGRLWTSDSEHGIAEGVLQDADDAYGSAAPTKYQHFLDTGVDTGVDH